MATAIQGNLGDLSSFQESHLLFRNKGSITSTLNMEALAQLSFSTGDTELFGLKTFGGSLYIPGLVTIGPTFKVLAVRAPPPLPSRLAVSGARL